METMSDFEKYEEEQKRRLIAGESLQPLPVVYAFLDSDEKAIYVGSSFHVEKRLTEHRRGKAFTKDDGYRRWMYEESEYIEIMMCESEEQMRFIEMAIISLRKPKGNREFKTSHLMEFYPVPDSMKIQMSLEIKELPYEMFSKKEMERIISWARKREYRVAGRNDLKAVGDVPC